MDKVQHFEIPSDDVARSRAFYETAFGWQTKEWPMPDGSTYIGLYTGPVDEKNMWKEPGFINGGMFKRGESFPVTNQTIAIVVQDIDASLAKVTAAGGSVLMEKKEIGGMGYYAYIQDTEGNTIGVWQDIKKEM
ncbi:MAG TPA: VOC family protein [Candidatus Paceibacterota bacterium]|nr:VOC family protein [Candidatus Paceibacterota bacterium]